MLYNLLSAFLLIFICWLWGAAFAKVLNLKKEMCLFEVSVGFVWMILILNLLYFRLDLHIKTVKMIVLAVSILAAGYICRQFQKKSVVSLLCTFCFFVLSASLAYMSYYRGFGENFYVFRGNIDDNFNYISLGYAVCKHNFSYYQEVSRELLFQENDLLIRGAELLANDRPSVTLPFALMLKEGMGSIYLSAYLYMSVLYGMLAPVIYFFYRQLTIKKPVVITWLFLASYLLGFWGQLHFDLNAWSQMGGIPVIFTIIRFVLLKLKKAEKTVDIKMSILITLSVTAAFLIYPEAGMVYAGGIGIYLLLYYISKRKSICVRDIIQWFVIIGCSAFLLVIVNANYKMAFSFMRNQLIGGITMKQDWWRTYDSYWVGRNASDHVLTNILNHMISFLGFYFLVPSAEGANIFLIIVEIIFIFTIITGIIGKCSQILRKRREDAFDTLFMELFIYSIMLIIYLLLQKNYWVLGKLMIWMSPVIYYMILCFVSSNIRYLQKYYSVFGGILIGANLLFYSARIGQAWNGTSEWYNNYPLLQWLRDSVEWKLDMSALSDSKVIRVEEEFSSHYFHYLKQTIRFAGREYYAERNMLIPYGNGTDYGKMPYMEYDSFVYLDAGDGGKRKLQYATQLENELPADILYQKIGLNPGSVFAESSGFISDIYGSWTSEHKSEVRLLEPLPDDFVQLSVNIDAFARAESEVNGKTMYIEIGDERKALTINAAGSYSVSFDHVKGQDEIVFWTDNLLTPYEQGWSADKE
ncbi:MAG: hypothetical protein K2P69_16735, partial [Eubacterium sp.]|nr:hypothetical protein [Eubacterium sp.]